MDDKEIEKIAQAIAAKIAEPGANKLLGCGDASSSQNYNCSSANYNCSSYECGGAGNFTCGTAGSFQHRCSLTFDCRSNFTCNNFSCGAGYNL